MTTGKRMNFSSQRRDRSDRAYLFTRPKAKVCKCCTTILRTGNTTGFCSLHTHFSVIEKDQKLDARNSSST